MSKYIYIFAILLAFGCKDSVDKEYYSVDELRDLYSSGNPENWPEATIDSNTVNFQDIGVLPELSFTEENPYSDAKRELGKLLFHDPRLSGSKQIACASCHDPDLGWTDGKRVAFGHDRSAGERNTLSILNIGYASPFFWDGRAANLKEQATAALENPIEMNHQMEIAVEDIKTIKGYQEFFKKAFGEEEVTKDKILDAIITFERTIVSRKSKFDKFIEGDSTQLDNAELRGLHLFRTKARCINCHNSPLFSDQQFHNVGLSYYGRKFEDLGRYNITQKPEDVGRFKTPSLRELTHTGPYMHNGLFPHLEGIINMYNAGMPTLKRSAEQEKDSLFPEKSNLLQELELTKKEQEDLEAFLESLSSIIHRERPPESLPQ